MGRIAGRCATLLAALGTAIAFAFIPRAALAGPALSGVNNNPGVTSGCGNFTCGFQFVANQASVVTRLGVYDQASDGLNIASTVGIWNISGTLLGSATLAAGASGDLIDGYRYADISAVNLIAGSTYVLGASDLNVAFGLAGVTVDPAISVGLGVFNPGSFAFPGTVDNFGGSNRVFLAGNMILNPATQVPEPATLALVTFLLMGFGLRRSRPVKT